MTLHSSAIMSNLMTETTSLADIKYILTWQQVMQFIINIMNDMSMLYKILGCVSWSNNKQPYPLCKCNKGVAFGNPNHVCHLIKDDEWEQCYQRSLAEYAKLQPS